MKTVAEHVGILADQEQDNLNLQAAYLVRLLESQLSDQEKALESRKLIVGKALFKLNNEKITEDLLEEVRRETGVGRPKNFGSINIGGTLDVGRIL